MAEPIRKHDPEKCEDGDDCKECEITENSSKLIEAARARVKRHTPTVAMKKRAIDMIKRSQIERPTA